MKNQKELYKKIKDFLQKIFAKIFFSTTSFIAGTLFFMGIAFTFAAVDWTGWTNTGAGMSSDEEGFDSTLIGQGQVDSKLTPTLWSQLVTNVDLNKKNIDYLQANSSTDWSSITNIPDSFNDGIDNVDDADADETNELQGLNFDTNTNELTITDKSGSDATVDLSSLSDVDTTGSTINFMSEPVYLFESHSDRQSDIDDRVNITGGTIGNNDTTFTIDITDIFTNEDTRKQIRGVGLSIYADSDVYLWNDLDDSTTFKNASKSAKDIFRFAKDGDHGSSSAFIPVINDGTKVTFDMHINDGDQVALYLTHYSVGTNIDAGSNPVKKMYTKDDYLSYNGKITL